jgi:hypothetical protein
MPTKEDIISGLQTIVNDYQTFAIVWHIIFYVVIASLIFLWRPSNKVVALLMCIPIISVAIFAWISGNPFNGFLFTVLAILIIIFGLKASNAPINVSNLPYLIVGILMIVFGLVYPHFINADSFIKYLYASPVGLIPCPTLSILIGFLLLYNGLGSQSLTLTFVIFGLFYGIFGALKLAVYLDVFLILGATTLMVKYLLTLRGQA